MKIKYVFLIFYIYYISMLRHFIGIYWYLLEFMLLYGS